MSVTDGINMSANIRIAEKLNITERQAHQLCLQIQQCCRQENSTAPSFKNIAKAIDQFPSASPKEIAEHILANRVINVSVSRKKTKHYQTVESFLLPREKLIQQIALLIPDEDKGNEDIAKQFLIDLFRHRPEIDTLDDKQILSVIKKSRRNGRIEFELVIQEIRKEVYGYDGEPDRVQIIYTPMGGKP